MKIVDVRAGCRVLNLLQFPAGPARVMFHPKHTSAVVLASDAGLVQIQDADGRGGSGFVSHHLDLRGQRLASVAACRTGEMMAYGDTAGFVHVWSVNDEPGCNPYSVPTEVPPGEARVRREVFRTGSRPRSRRARSHRAAAVPRGGPHRAAVIVFRSGVDRGGWTRPAHHPERGDEGDADGPRFRRIRAESASQAGRAEGRGVPRGGGAAE